MVTLLTYNWESYRFYSLNYTEVIFQDPLELNLVTLKMEAECSAEASEH